MTSDDLHGLTAAYALDALDQVERRRYERHLDSCASCVTELRGFRDLSARLAAASATDPPPALRERMLVAITDRVQERADSAPIRRPHRWVAAATAAFAAAAVAAAVVFGIAADHSQGRLTATQREQREIANLLAAPDSKIVRAPIRTGGTATVVMSEREHALVLTAARLAPAPPGQRYQLWLMRSSGDTRAGTLPTPGGGPVMVMAKGAIAGQRLGISLEHDTHPSRPTPPMLAIIQL